LVIVLDAQDAWAWGPGVHTLTALSALKDLGSVLPVISGIISSFPREYVYGCLAADFFIGKGKRRQTSHPHNWEGGFKFLEGTGDEREAAYAYGFLSHLAADVVAHNFFVPNMLRSRSGRRRRGHLYWEFQADHLAGSMYTKIARNILSSDHHECDELLSLINGKGKNGLKAKKRLYTQTVKVSDFFNGSREFYGTDPVPHGRTFYPFTALMIDLSCRMVKDFLRDPELSPCLVYDPMGKRNLLLAKRNRMLKGNFRSRRSIPTFSIDQELLRL
jgi:hypothetical protein